MTFEYGMTLKDLLVKYGQESKLNIATEELLNKHMNLNGRTIDYIEYSKKRDDGKTFDNMIKNYISTPRFAEDISKADNALNDKKWDSEDTVYLLELQVNNRGMISIVMEKDSYIL